MNMFSKNKGLSDADKKDRPELTSQVLKLKDIPKTFKENIPFDLIDIVNYRKTVSIEKLKETGKSISSNGLLQPIGLISLENGRYQLAFGQCRTLSMRDYTDLESVPIAIVWNESALQFIKTIALVENITRDDPPLDEEANGILEAIQGEYSGYEKPMTAFSDVTGIPLANISKKIKIAEAMKSDEGFKQLVLSNLVKDTEALYMIAQAVELNPKKARKKYIDKVIDLLSKDELSGNARKVAKEVKKHVKEGGRPPEIKTKTEALQENNAPSTIDQNQKATTKANPRIKLIESIISEDWADITDAENAKLVELNKLVKGLLTHDR